MIPSAPTDLWDRVVDKLARLIFDRETNLERAAYVSKLPHLAPTISPTVDGKPVDKAS